MNFEFSDSEPISLLSSTPLMASQLELTPTPSSSLENPTILEEGTIAQFNAMLANEQDTDLLIANHSLDPLTGVASAPNPSVFSLGLMNAVSDQWVPGFENLGANNTINLNGLNLTQYNIVALVNPDHVNAGAVSSIRFESSLGNKIENVAPYALFGDNGKGDYYGKAVNLGNYSFKATAYSGKTASGNLLDTVNLNVNFVNNIDNPPPEPSLLSIADISVDENSGTATFSVNLSKTSNTPVTVNYATANGSALAGSDYVATNGTLTFAPGETTQEITVSVIDNVISEAEETFTLNLSNAVGAKIAAGVGKATIRDNDFVLYRVNAGGESVAAADGGLSWSGDTATNPSSYLVTSENKLVTSSQTVNLSHPTLPHEGEVATLFQSHRHDGASNPQMTWAFPVATGSEVEVRFYFAEWWNNNTLGARVFDIAVEGSVPAAFDNIDPVASAGQWKTGFMRSHKVTVQDGILNLDFVNHIGNPAVAAFEILKVANTPKNPDVPSNPPSLTMGDVTVNENDGQATFTVNLSQASSVPITVNYATANGSALAGSDYLATNGSLTFAAGETRRTFSVNLKDDTQFEESETFTVNLSNVTGGATITKGMATATILDNDTPVVPGTKSSLDRKVETKDLTALQEIYNVTFDKRGKPDVHISLASSNTILLKVQQNEYINDARTKEDFVPEIFNNNLTVDNVNIVLPNGNVIKPLAVHRKTKIADSLKQVNNNFILDHFFHIELPQSLSVNGNYTVRFTGGNLENISFSPQNSVSLAIHHARAYDIDDPVKHAKLSSWDGVSGVNYQEGTVFRIRNEATGSVVHTGTITLDTANDVFAGTNVYNLDFSAVKQAGSYRIEVDGIGQSLAFDVRQGVWESLLDLSMEGLYVHRAFAKMEQPYTSYERPGNPNIVFYQSSVSEADLTFSLKNLDARFDLLPASADYSNPIKLTGGWFDAGDYDTQTRHIPIIASLVDLYNSNPDYYRNFNPNIPESGDNIPDVLNEALWGMQLYTSLQRADGGVSGGFEFDSHPNGTTSWEEVKAFIYAPDYYASYQFANSAAKLATALEPYDASQSADLRERAIRAMNWAENEYARLPVEIQTNWNVKRARQLAAVEVYRITNTKQYHDIFISVNDRLNYDATFVYAKLDSSIYRDVNTSLQQTLKTKLIEYGDTLVNFGQKNGFDTINDPSSGQYWGNNTVITTQNGHYLAMAHQLTGEAKYLNALAASMQFGIGINPDNTAYTTGTVKRGLAYDEPDDVLNADGHRLDDIPDGITIYGFYSAGWFSWSTVNNATNNIFFNDTTKQLQVPLLESFNDYHNLVPLMEYTVHQTIEDQIFAFGYLAQLAHTPSSPNPDPTPVPPTLSIADLSVNEGAGAATFTVNLSKASTQKITVDYGTVDNTALAGQDYNTANGTLTFAAGQTSQTLTVNIKEDTLVEGNEFFTVKLNRATGATIADGTAMGTILDNDTAPPSGSGERVILHAMDYRSPNDDPYEVPITDAKGTLSNEGTQYNASTGKWVTPQNQIFWGDIQISGIAADGQRGIVKSTHDLIGVKSYTYATGNYNKANLDNAINYMADEGGTETLILNFPYVAQDITLTLTLLDNPSEQVRWQGFNAQGSRVKEGVLTTADGIKVPALDADELNMGKDKTYAFDLPLAGITRLELSALPNTGYALAGIAYTKL